MTDTMTSQNIDLPSRSRAGAKDTTVRPSQTTKMALSWKPFGIVHMFVWSFLIRMTDTMTSQNIVLSSWDTLYNGPTNALVCNKTLIHKSHTKIFKITPTCFDHQMIIIREHSDPG
jgi:hypothetical protein